MISETPSFYHELDEKSHYEKFAFEIDLKENRQEGFVYLFVFGKNA